MVLFFPCALEGEMASPRRIDTKLWELQERLEKCWGLSVTWNLYPKHIKDVSLSYHYLSAKEHVASKLQSSAAFWKPQKP